MHWLTIPADPLRAMAVEHPADCPARVKLVNTEGTETMLRVLVCRVANLERLRGLESFFARLGQAEDGYEAEDRLYLPPGVYPVGWEDAQIRLLSEVAA